MHPFLLHNVYASGFFELVDVKNKWENSSWGRKLIVKKRREALTDFDRFKLMLAKIKVCPATIKTSLDLYFARILKFIHLI